jgi:hypothetical protein
MLAGLALLLPLLAGLGPARPAAAAPPPARVAVDSLDPTIATPGSVLRVTGRVANTGRQDLRNVEVRLRLSDSRLGSRAELDAVAEGRTSSRDGEVIATGSLPDLAPGQTVPFDLSRELDELSALTDFGVYVLGVEVLASRSQGFGRVAIVRTLLPWVPDDGAFEPTGFTWLWPLVSRPTRLADGTYAEDTLAQEMEPGGRLTRLTEAGARLDQGAALTWVVDPELLDAAADMADGYQVRSPDGSVVPGGGAALASRWLDEVRAATAGQPVLALPYGDPDLTALERGGLGGDTVRARREGQATVERLLPAAVPLVDTSWPVDGFTNRSTLSALRRDGVTTVVLDGRALPTELDLSYTPSGRAHVATRSGRLAGVLGEPGLADRLRLRGADPLLGAQRLLAETALITSELPSTGTERTIVLTPPRRWDPSAEYLDRLADGGAQAPWMAPVPLGQLAATEPPEVDREPLRYPAAQRRLELPRTYRTALEGTHTSINVFSAILTDRTQLVPDLNRAVLRLESSWWRGRASRVNRLARERDYLADLRNEVRVQPGNFTFSSHRGTIPLTVANGLEQEVVVGLRLDPQTQRLRLEPTGLLRIGPRQKVQVEVRATAIAAGSVVVDASLHTPGGAAYGQPVPLRVTITEYGTVALWITVVAAAVLFLMAGLQVLRRVLAARRGEPPPGLGPDRAGPATEPVPAPDERAAPQPEHERLP